MSAPPPPPPPHGEAPKTTAGGSGLPPGKYDVFIIPEHSAGSGFLYLPSLRTNTNSFIAGFASALVMVVLGQSMAPAFQAWWANFQGMGNAGMMLLMIAIGLGAWSLGRQSTDSSGSPRGDGGGFYTGGGGGGSSMPGGGGFSNAGSGPHSAHPGSPPPNSGPPPNAHSPPPPGGSQPGADKPSGSYQRPPPPQPQPQADSQPSPPPRPQPQAQPQPPPPPPPQPQPSTAKPKAESARSAWEKARDEVRRKEEERKAKEADEKRRADAAARLKELREKEARERAAREADRTRREKEAQEKAAREREAKEKEAKEKEAKERREKEQREAREKEVRERLVREREERRKKLEEEKKRKEEEAAQARKSGSYSFSGVGEKLNPWPNGKPPAAAATPSPASTPSASPTKGPPPPTARTFVGSEDAYSYRPYDNPKRPTARRMSNSDYSESSWAPSQSTARTTPPPSVRGPYSTKDPDKIVIKAVYCFMNQFAKTPASQLLSGVGSVTDGLILRITTEGLFIDDDVRGVAQREWDVKAWTLKNVEVWCPMHFLACAIAANSPLSPTGAKPSKDNISTAFFAKTIGGAARLRAAERANPKALTGDDADTYLTEVLASCKNSCRLGDCASKFAPSNLDEDAPSVASGSTRNTNSTAQNGEWKTKGLHLLRATVRDQDGKRYMFVVGEEEGWKIAVGLQRLRRGTQVRSLGVAGLGGLETKNTLEMLGWG